LIPVCLPSSQNEKAPRLREGLFWGRDWARRALFIPNLFRLLLLVG
jgi:hypothetical protein